MGVMTTLSPAGAAKLDALLADQVANADLPALFYGITTAEGEIYFNCAGRKNQGDPEEGDVDENTTLQLWSMTKLITSIACLQLIESGILCLDDPCLIETHLPELWRQAILTGFTDGVPDTTPRQGPITLEHLLTHTSGAAYTFSSPLIAQYKPVPAWLQKNVTPESLAKPTVFEPGTHYCYGTGLDWAGILVERVTGHSLEDYFHTHIFGPSGVCPTDITFLPTPDILQRLMTTCARAPDGSLVPSPGMRDIKSWTPEDIGVQLGGGGLLGTPRAYMAVLRQILLAKDGQSKVISPFVYRSLFAPVLPAVCKPDLGRMVAFEGMKEEQFISGEKIQHSLGMCLMLADSADGPKAGSGSWGGAARTRFWVDPETGIAGWYGTQLMDMGQPLIFCNAFEAFQRALYEALEL